LGLQERRLRQAFGFRFSITSGTIFENTQVALNIWFRVGYLMLTRKKEISALQIHRVMFGEKSTPLFHSSKTERRP